jgi:acyl carrier protein
MGEYLLKESPLPSIGRSEEDVIKFVGDYLGIPSFRLNLETKIMGDNFGTPSFKLTETKLVKHLKIHPVDLRELIMTIEEKFEIRIPNEEIISITRIQDIVDAVKRALERPEVQSDLYCNPK